MWRPANFDHSLYFQGIGKTVNKWIGSDVPLSQFMQAGGMFKSDKTAGIIKRNERGWKRDIHGIFKNQDVWVPIVNNQA
jgi:hypothetical protein